MQEVDQSKQDFVSEVRENSTILIGKSNLQAMQADKGDSAPPANQQVSEEKPLGMNDKDRNDGTARAPK